MTHSREIWLTRLRCLYHVPVKSVSWYSVVALVVHYFIWPASFRDWPLNWLTNHHPSVLWHLVRSYEMTCNVWSWTLNSTIPLSVTDCLERLVLSLKWPLCVEWLLNSALWLWQVSSNSGKTPLNHVKGSSVFDSMDRSKQGKHATARPAPSSALHSKKVLSVMFVSLYSITHRWYFCVYLPSIVQCTDKS